MITHEGDMVLFIFIALLIVWALYELFLGKDEKDIQARDSLARHIRLIQMDDYNASYAEEDEFSYYPLKVKADKDPKDAS